jgi:uncharacterized protein
MDGFNFRLPDRSAMSAPHDGKSDEDIARLLALPRTIAVIGASANPARPSNRVMAFLIGEGFTIIPVNPGQAGREILGRKTYGKLADVPGPVQIVDIFRNSEAALGAVREAIAETPRLAIEAVWMQLGVINETAAREAVEAGLEVVMDRCPKIELPRLAMGSRAIRRTLD